MLFILLLLLSLVFFSCVSQTQPRFLSHSLLFFSVLFFTTLIDHCHAFQFVSSLCRMSILSIFSLWPQICLIEMPLSTSRVKSGFWFFLLKCLHGDMRRSRCACETHCRKNPQEKSGLKHEYVCARGLISVQTSLKATLKFIIEMVFLVLLRDDTMIFFYFM